MKKTFTLILALTMAVGTFAQKIEPSDTQMWWGYYSESDAQKLDLVNDGLGMSSAATLDAAIYIPKNHPIAGGSTIKAVRIWLGADITKVTGNVKVWISKSQPTDVSKASYTQSVALSTLSKGLNDIALTTPYAVNNEGIYVGVTLTTNQRAYPFLCNGDDVPNSFYFRYSTTDGWIDLYGYGYGKLALQVLLDGGDYPSHRVTAEDFGQNIVVKGQEAKVPVKITNGGKEAVTSISYTIATNDGAPSSETTLSVGSLAYSGTYTTSITMPSGSEARKEVKTITITKVNGLPNTAANPSAKGNLITITQPAAATPVVEEFTGTWCGYCPYGIVGMQKAHDTFGDRVVLIAAHNGDPMTIDGYNPIMQTVSGFPSANLNRDLSFYPSSDVIVGLIQDALNRATQGSIKLTATWGNIGKSLVCFDTETTFVYDDNDGKYGIAFVLVEDGLKGTGSKWAQSNYMSGGSGDADMSFWYRSGSSVTGIEFNHVAVAAWDILNGVKNSVSPTIVADEPQTFSYKAGISGNSLIQDKTKLKAVALLIDQVSGTIVNAAQATIQDYSSGVEALPTDDAIVVSCYALDGREVAEPQKGLNIVKMSDGTTRKVFVK